MISTDSIRALVSGFSCSTDQLMPWIVRSRAELGELKGFSQLFRSREPLLHPVMLMDAVDSLAIEEINTTRDGVLESQLYNEPEQPSEHRQVIQYRDALLWAADQVATKGMSPSLMTELYGRIAAERTAGRKSNTVPQERAHSAENMQYVVEFIRQDDNQLDPLTRCIMAYGMLELAQPFEDRNGTMARLFLVLSLIQTGLLKVPVISIHSYLRKNQANIQRLVRDIPTGGNWCPLIKYLMHGFFNQARETRERLQKIEEAYRDTDKGIREQCAQIYTPELVYILHALPVISPLRLSSRLEIHYTTATRYLKKLESEGFLENRQAGKYQLYSNKSLVGLLVTGD